jgi:hypothetical protein
LIRAFQILVGKLREESLAGREWEIFERCPTGFEHADGIGNVSLGNDRVAREN